MPGMVHAVGQDTSAQCSSRSLAATRAGDSHDADQSHPADQHVKRQCLLGKIVIAAHKESDADLSRSVELLLPMLPGLTSITTAIC